MSRNTDRLLGGFDRNELSTQLISDQNVTAEPIRQNQIGLTIASNLFVTKPESDVVASGSTSNVIVLTTNTLQVGDIVSFTSGSLTGTQVKVKSVDGFNVTLVNNLSSIPTAGNTVDILRYIYPLTDSTGTINVNVVSAPPSPGSLATNTNIYNEITSVPTSVLSSIITYTVPPSSNFFFSLAEVAGTNTANYSIYIDGSVIARKYTYFGGELNADFEFDNYKLTAGQVITVKVIQNRPYVGDFAGRILGTLTP